jgi:hypothetical protein
MKRTSLLLLIAGLLAGCLCPVAPLLVMTSSPKPAEPTLLAQIAPTADMAPPLPPLRPDPSPTHARTTGSGDLTLVRLHPEDGALSMQLGEEAGKPHALGQHMVVEFDAEW